LAIGSARVAVRLTPRVVAEAVSAIAAAAVTADLAGRAELQAASHPAAPRPAASAKHVRRQASIEVKATVEDGAAFVAVALAAVWDTDRRGAGTTARADANGSSEADRKRNAQQGPVVDTH
jgi:hypothetical protein